jgi:glycosyltransferase involved in cell wall biosynthesis
MEPLFTIIIPTYNRLPVLKQTLRMYESQRGVDFPFEMIVVDDGSTDGTWDYLQGYHPTAFRLSVFRQENGGPARARNLAIGRARGAYLLITGDDIVPSEDLLAGHAAAHRAGNESVAVLGKILWHPELAVGPVMRHIDGVGGQQFGFHYMKNGERYDCRYFYTSNISLPRARVMELDRLFDTDFIFAAYEDVEFAYRLMGDRKEIVYHEEIVGYHHHLHTLDSFIKRQYRTGKMALVLVARHPALAGKASFGSLRRALDLALTTFPTATLEELRGWEEAIVETFRHYDNASENPDWIGPVYNGIFRYFYDRGIADDYLDSPALPSILASLMSIHLAGPVGESLAGGGVIASPAQRATLADMVARCASHAEQPRPTGTNGSISGRVTRQIARVRRILKGSSAS